MFPIFCINCCTKLLKNFILYLVTLNKPWNLIACVLVKLSHWLGKDTIKTKMWCNLWINGTHESQSNCKDQQRFQNGCNWEKYQLGDYLLIQYQIFQTNIRRILWQTVGRIAQEILEVKRLRINLQYYKDEWSEFPVLCVTDNLNTLDFGCRLSPKQSLQLFCLDLFCFEWNQSYRESNTWLDSLTWTVQPFNCQDLISNSPYCLLFNSYDVNLENLVLDHLIIPNWYFI